MQEMNYIVDEIVALVNSPDCPKDDDGNKKLFEIAIICKNNKELQEYSELLKSKNIRYQFAQGKSIFSVRSTILIYFYLKTLDNYLNNSDKLFGLLLSEPFKIDLEDYNNPLSKHQNHKQLTFCFLFQHLLLQVKQQLLQLMYEHVRMFLSQEHVVHDAHHFHISILSKRPDREA